MDEENTTLEAYTKCMAKYMGADEFKQWFRREKQLDRKMKLCVICDNKKENCILKHVGIPTSNGKQHENPKRGVEW